MHGLIGPDKFIELAERTKLIDSLGRWVIEEAIREMALRRDQNNVVWPTAVNVSFVQISSGSLVGDIKSVLEKHGLAAHMLELELTESVVMEDSQLTIAMLNEVASLGIKVALDDFGTGYSSLAYVRLLPLNYLKIDRSFVTNLQSDPQSQVVTSGVIGLAQGLKLVTIAEGIETEEHYRWLLENGCQLGQGYWFSKPVPTDELDMAVAAIEARASAQGE